MGSSHKIDMQIVACAIAKIQDQFEAIGRAIANVDLSGFERLVSRHMRLPVYDQPPPRAPHHAHLIQQHIRSVRKPRKYQRPKMVVYKSVINGDTSGKGIDGGQRGQR